MRLHWGKYYRMKRKILHLLVLVAMVTLSSCTQSGDTIYVDDDEELLNDKRPVVFFIYGNGDMGDLGYIDNLYRGVVKATDAGDMLLSCAELPSDTSKIADAFRYFLDYMQQTGQRRRALVVIANNNYEPLLHSYGSLLSQNNNVDVLLVESNDTTLPVYSVQFPQYGVYYQAGCVVGSCLSDVGRVLVATANAATPVLAEMRQGFADGMAATNGAVQVDNRYLSDRASGGYNVADSVYRRAAAIDSLYQMVVPLCGGTVQGFLRYNREHPASFYTLGVDTDMQAYSSRVPFSVVKHLDQAVQQWITRWAAGDKPDKHQSLGLASGYTELVISDAYKSRIGTAADLYLSAAIAKENEYGKE